MKTVGFIGTGNMGSALARAVSKSEIASIKLANRTKKKASDLAKEIGGKVVTNKQAANSDFVFLAVKPYQAKEVLAEIKSSLNYNTVIVSMMNGYTIDKLRKEINLPIIRIMPNTPVAVGEGMTLYTFSDDVKKEDVETFKELMKNSGKLEIVDEHLFDEVSAITGCGPAYADMFVDALAIAGVKLGIPRKRAEVFAAQMLLGSSKLMLESGKHPEQLKDEVCSPGGSTIEGVVALEKNAFKSSVIEAILAAYKKNKEMAK